MATAPEREIRAFAERVLLSPEIEDKLAPPGPLDDAHPGPPVAGITEPARPPGMRFRELGGRAPFPRPATVGDPANAAAVLHTFANHELLAMETMALFLLRQTDAPTAFRRGLARVLAEEQIHLSMYIDRMAQLGLRFGALPVNRFMWDCVADAADPADFAARMGLTFESANLDHALAWAGAFRAVGDHATAAIMDRVYADEIGHVRHAMFWFKRAQPEGADLFERYRDGLRLPLTAERAKGEPFSAEARRLAGFDEAFIEAVSLYHHSKGRPPTVRWFNPDAEAQVAAADPDLQPTGPALELALDLDLLPVALSAKDDVIVVRAEPRRAHLGALQAAGLTVPQLVVCPDLRELGGTALQGRKLGAIDPWGWSPVSARWAEPLLPGLVSGPEPGWSAERAVLYTKGFAAELNALSQTLHDDLPGIEPAGLAGLSAGSAAEVDAHLARWRREGFETVVIKAPYGTAGRGARRLTGPLQEPDRRWLTRALGAGAPVVVEPWLSAALDLSFHFDIERNGTWRYKGVTRFFTTSGGRYRASWCGPLYQDLDPELTRFLHAEGQERRWLERVGRAVAQIVGQRAAALGHRGPIGVDALVHRHQGRLVLRPIVEVNPRTTMGRVALRLADHVAPQRAALFAVLSRGDLREAGHRDFAAYARGRAPVTIADGRVSGGVLFLTDPEAARAFAAVLAVGDTEQACWRALLG